MPIGGLPSASGMVCPEYTECVSPGATPKMNIPVSDTAELIYAGDPQSQMDCFSPGVTPKMASFSSASNSVPYVPYWPQNFESMSQMAYIPSAESFGCPVGGMMMVPYQFMAQHAQFMMDQNAQFVPYPCPADQNQKASMASSSHVTNAFHMPMESESQASESASEHPPLPDDIAALGDPHQMIEDAEFAQFVENLLETSSVEKNAAIVTWMQDSLLALALSASGTRVVQKALEVTGGDIQLKLSQCLHGKARHLLDSHHGNHVLQQSIVVMPPHALQFILEELSYFRGGWAGVARHRFGCRVVERLLEHVEANLTTPIVAAVVTEIDSLARHPFANYVVQHILEYGAPNHRTQVVHAMIGAGVEHLAQHRVASNIVERAFEHGGAENQRALAESILSTPHALVEMGCSRYGSFTVRRMLEKLKDPLLTVAVQQLSLSLSSLRASKHGRHVAARVSAAMSGSSRARY